MRASLIIAAHNEGDLLGKTVGSCVETCAGLDHEIVLADDASEDGSLAETSRRFPRVRVVRHERRQGASPAKHLGAQAASGRVLVFLDGHTKPGPGAVQRLVEDVERLDGQAVVTPAVAGLKTECWTAVAGQVGHGYALDLERFDCGWLALSALKTHRAGGRTFYESPALIGCAVALSRELYDRLWGFDPHMRIWGVEDLDFGLKAWLMGYPILHDPAAVVAHRFRRAFDNYAVPVEHLIVNQLRMARKHFTPAVWGEWLDRCRQRHAGRLAEHPEGLWARVWQLFEECRSSVEEERAYLQSRRLRDEFWYAQRFGLEWPRLHTEAGGPSPTAFAAREAEPSPSPSPAPCSGCRIARLKPDGDDDMLIGQRVELRIDCDEGTINTDSIRWSLPSHTVKDYVVVNGPPEYSATLTHNDSDDLKQQSVSFYNVTGGTKQVSVSFDLMIGGAMQHCTEELTLTVQSPTVETTEPTSVGKATAVVDDQGSPLVQLRGSHDPPNDQGIRFTAKVTTPAGFDGHGEWQFTQLWHASRVRKIAATGNCREAKGSTPKSIDNQFDFGGPWPADGVKRTSTDSPFSRRDPAIFSQLNSGDHFVMYLMYKPPGAAADVIWVPLKVLLWSFVFCAVPNATKTRWIVKDDESDQLGWKDETSHPTWTKQLPSDFSDGPVQCPEPCSP